MPELPDVEVFIRHINSTAVGHRVTDVTLRRERDIVSGVSPARLRHILRGAPLESTRRHGKFAFVELRDRGWLALHVGLTGFVRYFKSEEDEPEHTRLLLRLDNGYHLAYVCQRLLGRIDQTSDVGAFVDDEGLGPDALSIRLDPFQELVSGSRGMIKTTLMNQRIIAGIGNIYSDEILFHARVHPRTGASELGERRTARLHRSMLTVLRTAIRHNADPDGLPGSYLLPRREEGAACPDCGGKVAKIRIGGRSAYYCTECQRK
jgi:formamidopyrimidine-DNA glycosylase